MTISKLNTAILVQIAGAILFMGVGQPWARVAGIAVVVIGGILYRNEKKRMKSLLLSQLAAAPDGNSQPLQRPTFLANLNLFIPYAGLATAAGSIIASGLIMVILAPLKNFIPTAEAYGIGEILPAIAVAVYAFRYGLAPKQRDPMRESRYRLGHAIVAITNIGVVSSFVAPFAIAAATGNPDMILLGWLVIPVVLVALITWTLGTFLIRSASMPG